MSNSSNLNDDVAMNYQQVCDSKTSDKTKSNYLNRIKAFVKWLRQKHTDCFEDNDEEEEDEVSRFDSDLDLSRISEPILEEWITETSVYAKGKNKGLPKSKSTPEGNRAALLWYFDQQKTALPSAFRSTSKDFLKGIGKKIATLKANGEIDTTEGKDVLTFEGYKMLCQLAVKASNCLTAHLFLTLAWNLMTRSATTSILTVRHLCWGGDCIKVTWGGKHKGSQSGDQGSKHFAAQVRHIYANPNSPEMCCFLALGVWLVSSSSMHENSALFPSNSEEANFNNWLKGITSGMTDTDQMEAGYNFGRIGSHSTKKGGTTYASSLPGFCSIIAAWLRAGWSLGCVLPAYIHATDGGDQSVGRLLTGLDPSTSDLSILPPRFRNTDIQSIKWEELLVDFAKYPQDFKIVVPYLIASVVHHSEYLCKSLSSTHPIFVSRFWRSGAQITLRSHVLAPVRMRCDITGMIASGVAPITQIYHKIDTFSNDLIAKVSEVKASSQPLSREDLTVMEDRLSEKIIAAICKNDQTPQRASSHTSQTTTPYAASANVQPFANWTWGGEFGRPVPPDEQFPTK
jgi:hypothetical protein